jgi:hypothetical protein
MSGPRKKVPSSAETEDDAASMSTVFNLVTWRTLDHVGANVTEVAFLLQKNAGF